jgi:hypothetical protein
VTEAVAKSNMHQTSPYLLITFFIFFRTFTDKLFLLPVFLLPQQKYLHTYSELSKCGDQGKKYRELEK